MLPLCQGLQLNTTANSDCAVQFADPGTYLWLEIDTEMGRRFHLHSVLYIIIHAFKSKNCIKLDDNKK